MKRYFIIYFWGLKNKLVLPATSGGPNQVTTQQFYANMNCVTDGEYPNCDICKEEGLKLIKNTTDMVITGISELSKKDFDDWNKKQPSATKE